MPVLLMPMTEKRRNEAFAAYLNELAAGRSSRQLARETGVNATTIADARWGEVPGFRTLERLARGMELAADERAELFRRAGYTPDDEEPTATAGADLGPLADRLTDFLRERDEVLSGADILAAGIRELAEEYGVTEPNPRFERGRPSLSPDDAYTYLRLIRILIEAGHIRRQDADDAKDPPRTNDGPTPIDTLKN